MYGKKQTEIKKLRKLTKSLGGVLEKEDYILCKVNPIILKEYINNNYGDGLLILDTKRLKEKYHINKDIIFEITGYNFEEGLYLITDASVSFDSCVFHDDIYVKAANKITFENNWYYNNTDTYKHSDRFIDISNVNEVNFTNETIYNKDNNNPISMKIKASTINFNNSLIFPYNNSESIIDEVSSLNLQAKEINIDNTQIEGYSTFIQAQNVQVSEWSYIGSKKSIFIDNMFDINSEQLNSEQIIINGEKIKQGTHVLKK